MSDSADMSDSSDRSDSSDMSDSGAMTDSTDKSRHPESWLSNQVAEKPIITFSDDMTSR